ncbi:hypothetical protein ACFQ07_07620, partial [Actinomadura adrarensis]
MIGGIRMPENGTPAADEHGENTQPDVRPEFYEKVSGRTMLLLGGVSSVAAVVVLALTLVIAPGSRDTGA